MSALMLPPCEFPHDPALPGLGFVAAPERMLEILRENVRDVPETEREGWKACAVREAVYQPGRACRISYALGDGNSEREDLVYARWDVEDRPHTSATSICADGAQFDVFRYPRDRRMRQIRSMQRGDWLRRASESWFRNWLGEGRFAADGWRCSPIKYVPESRLVCRLKGRWITGVSSENWHRAYVRISRRNDAQFQFDTLRTMAQSFADQRAGVTVPRALGCLPDMHLLATEFIRGRTLRDVAHSADHAAVADVCRRLASVANFNANLPSSISQPTDSVAPHAMLSDLAIGHPAIRPFCIALKSWAGQTPPMSSVPGLIHGDLHGGQIILKGERACIVDWERAAIGDPTQDITNLAAEFSAARWLDDDTSSAERPDLAAICINSWRSAGGVWAADAARWWTTRALVLRAWGLLRHLRPGWPAATRRLLDQAFRVFENGTDWLR